MGPASRTLRLALREHTPRVSSLLRKEKTAWAGMSPHLSRSLHASGALPANQSLVLALQVMTMNVSTNKRAKHATALTTKPAKCSPTVTMVSYAREPQMLAFTSVDRHV